MEVALDTVFGIWIGLASLLVLLALTRVFAEGRDKGWKFYETTLRPWRWVTVMILFGLMILAANHLNDWYRDQSERASVPGRDTGRFSFVVADFQGDGGAELANTIADELEASLGSGVQVRRVPFRMHTRGYGDVGSQRLPNRLSSLICARDYDADVVIWGSYDRANQLVQLSHTTSARPCANNCGLTSRPRPQYVPVSDLTVQNSTARGALLGSIASAAMMPINSDVAGLGASRCGGQPDVATAQIRKILSFLRGAPTGIPGEDMAKVYMSLGIYETRLAERRGDGALAARAARHIRAVRALAPAEWNAMSAVYSDALAVEAQFAASESRIRQIAEELSDLTPPVAEPNLVAGTLEATGRAWYLLHGLTQDAADFDRGISAFERALAVNFDEFGWKLGLRNTLSLIWIARLDQTGRPEYYRNAGSHVQQAAEFYSHLSDADRIALPPETRYDFFAAQLGLAKYADTDLIIDRIIRVQQDGILEVRNWGSNSYLDLQRQYGAIFLAAYSRTSDATYALQSAWINAEIIRHVPPRSEGAANANFDAGVAYLSLYHHGGGGLAKRRAKEYFYAAAMSYRALRRLEAADASLENFRRLDAIVPQTDDPGLAAQIEAADPQIRQSHRWERWTFHHPQ